MPFPIPSTICCREAPGGAYSIALCARIANATEPEPPNGPNTRDWPANENGYVVRLRVTVNGAPTTATRQNASRRSVMLILSPAYARRTSLRDIASIDLSSSAVSGPPALRASSADRSNGVSAHQKPAAMVALDARHAMTAEVTVTTNSAIAPIRTVAGTRRVIAAGLPVTRVCTPDTQTA